MTRAGQDYAALNRAFDRFIAQALEVNAPLGVMSHSKAPHGWEHQTDGRGTKEMIRQIRRIVRATLTTDEP